LHLNGRKEKANEDQDECEGWLPIGRLARRLAQVGFLNMKSQKGERRKPMRTKTNVKAGIIAIIAILIG